jgi:zinc and cadmium transporter
MFAHMDILLAAGSISSLSLLGVVFFGRAGQIVGTHRFIVPFAIGAFLAVTFFELIPETLEASESYGAIAIVSGFLLFYLLSNVLHTYHHHHDKHGDDDHCASTKVSAMMLLWGDAVHNLTDGIVITSAFFVNPAVGLITTFGIALHEIPQEIAEFGVLLKAGYSSKKALLLNFFSALGVVAGAALSLLFIEFLSSYIWVLTGVAAGNLLYIATSDLLPGVHKESHKSGSFIPAFLTTLAGIVMVGGLIFYTHTLS